MGVYILKMGHKTFVRVKHSECRTVRTPMGLRSDKSSLGLKSLIYFDSDVVTARHGHLCMRCFYFFCLFQSSRYGKVDGNINIQPLYKFSIKTFDPYILR